MEREICGKVIDVTFDKKIGKLNLELIHKDGNVENGDGCHLIALQDWTKLNKCKTILTLHIKEAIELKSIIDELIYEALTEPNTP